MYLTTLEPDLHIHCVEPSQSTFNQLKFNVESNHLQNVVSLYQMAVWKDHGQQNLFPGPSSGRRSLFPQSHQEVSGPSEIVNCTTLGELCEVCGETEVALVKIDTEGAELEIVEAASAETLRKIKRFAIEIHEDFRPGTRDRITKHLASHGFTLTNITTPPNRGNALGIMRAKRSETR